MHSKVLLALAALSMASATTDAPIVTGNPKTTYKANIVAKPNSTITGSVVAHAPADGTGIKFEVSLSGLPAGQGPFLYHIHESPVPADGNCTLTGAHLDPYARGETPPCDSTQPSTCQVGDLSGKHGKPTAPSFTAEYVDLYVSSIVGSQAFLGNRSIVVHNKDKVRLTCANFELYAPANGTSSTSTSYSNSTATATSVSTVAPASVTTTAEGTASVIKPTSTAASSTVAIASGAASANGLSAAAILMGGLAMLF